MLGILFRSPNVVFCGATLQLYGFKGSSIVVSSLPGIPNKCFCQAQGPVSRPILVNSWLTSQEDPEIGSVTGWATSILLF